MNWKDYPNTNHSATLALKEWAIIEVALRALRLTCQNADPSMMGVVSSSTLPHVEKILDRGTRHLRKRTKTTGYSAEAAKEADRRFIEDLWSQ